MWRWDTVFCKKNDRKRLCKSGAIPLSWIILLKSPIWERKCASTLRMSPMTLDTWPKTKAHATPAVIMMNVLTTRSMMFFCISCKNFVMKSGTAPLKVT